jgi:hypothetical protein
MGLAVGVAGAAGSGALVDIRRRSPDIRRPTRMTSKLKGAASSASAIEPIAVAPTVSSQDSGGRAAGMSRSTDIVTKALP